MTFEPEREGRLAVPLVRDLKESWWRWFPETIVKELQQWALGLGVGVAEILWQDQDGRWAPWLKVWHPSFVAWRADLRRWQVLTADGPILISPGDGKWVILSYVGRRPWMAGLVRRLSIPWLIRQFAWRDWARYSEVHGLPIRAGLVPASAKEEDKRQFLADLAGLGNEASIRLPQPDDKDRPGFDVKLIEAAARSWEGFNELIKTASTAIAVAVLGQNLTTEVGRGGSYAAATVHGRIRQDFLKADGELLSTALHDQVLGHWAAINYGRPSPWPRWDTTPPEDRKSETDRLKALLEALAQARQAGIPVDERAVLELAGVPLLSEDEAVERVPALLLESPQPAGPQATSRRVALTSGGDPGRAGGFISGQLYADLVADRMLGRAVESIAPDLEDLWGAVQAASDYDDLRRRLVETYGDMDPDRLGRLIEKALLLADLAGRLAVLQDL